MKTGAQAVATLLLVSLLLVSGPSMAAVTTPSSLTIENALRHCASIQPANERLSCFDGASADILKAIVARDIVVLDRAAVQRTRRGLFGFALPKIDIFGDRGKSADRDEIKQLQARATAVRSLGFGLWRVTLDEGGTWETTDVTDMHDPAVGSSILIKQAALGSYKMTIDGRQPPVHAHRID